MRVSGIPNTMLPNPRYYSSLNRTGWISASVRPTEIHVRGSRVEETEYRVNGLSVLDRWTNTSGIPFLPEMLENVDVHTGAYGVDRGGMGGGVVEMQLREGGEALNVEATYLTDDFAKPGGQFLNTSSYEWTTAVVTVGAPLPYDTRLFVAGEVSRQVNRQPTYLEPMDLTFGPNASLYPTYQPPPTSLRTVRNHVPGQSAERSVVQWNLVSTGLGPRVALFGSVSSSSTRDVTWPTAMTNYYRSDRMPWIDESATLIAARVDLPLTEDIEVRGSASYQGRRAVTRDPFFGGAWRLYSDSAANAAVGYPDFVSRYRPATQYSGILFFTFPHPSSPTTDFRQSASDAWRWSLGTTMAVTPQITMNASADVEWWTLRALWISPWYSGLEWLDPDRDGIVDRTFSDPIQKRVELKRYFSLRGFGYNEDGVSTEDGFDAPRHLFFASAQTSLTWVDGDASLMLGLRTEWTNPDVPRIAPRIDPITGRPTYDMLVDQVDWSHDIMKDEAFSRSPTTSVVLPRMAMAYQLSGGRVFASIGSFAESLPQHMLQIDKLELSDLMHPWRRVSYNLGGPLVTSEVGPSRTTIIEVGVERQLSSRLHMGLVGYHKRMSGQAQLGRLPADAAIVQDMTVAFVNDGEGSARGVEAAIRVDLADAITLAGAYAWSRAEGTASKPRSNQRMVTDESSWVTDPPPIVLRPLEYDRSHRFTGQLNFEPQEGDMLHGLVLRVRGSIESGTPYTKQNEELGYWGGTVWAAGVRWYLDPRLMDLVEPLMSSRTPWTSSLDLSASYSLLVGPVRLTGFVLITNLLDRKNVMNVYLASGSPTTDAWLESSRSQYARAYEGFEALYRVINLQNRWAFMSATGSDIYGTPRQIQFGVRVGI